MADSSEILVDQQVVAELFTKMNSINQYMYDELETLRTDTDSFLDEIKGSCRNEFASKSRNWESFIFSCQSEFSNLTLEFLNAASIVVDRDTLLATIDG